MLKKILVKRSYFTSRKVKILSYQKEAVECYCLNNKNTFATELTILHSSIEPYNNEIKGLNKLKI